MKKSVSVEEKEKIIYNYTVLNMGMRASGKEFNYSDKIVKKILLEKIVVNTVKQATSKKNKIQLIFNAINTTNINQDIIIPTNFQITHMNMNMKITHFLRRIQKKFIRTIKMG